MSNNKYSLEQNYLLSKWQVVQKINCFNKFSVKHLEVIPTSIPPQPHYKLNFFMKI